ncbi:H(+)/Cl(-) exchange transporter ClcA [Klebsiella michiganensis]|nr:H(+)/Cl(-) exchange transporter ClcA [Klebsiella michiganensis]
MVGYFLVRRFAPEAGGSGIPEIEGALEELRPVRWWRVLPVKFIGGMGTLGAGMVLGREGPMVQLGGNLGRMVVDVFRMRSPEARHTLLATGAAAGLSAAFNAPLAGILFIIEEMRPQFRYNLISIKAVFTGVIMATIVFRIFNGDKAVIEVGKLSNAPGQHPVAVFDPRDDFLAVLARCLIRWCCAPRICSSGSTAATLKNGC